MTLPCVLHNSVKITIMMFQNPFYSWKTVKRTVSHFFGMKMQWSNFIDHLLIFCFQIRVRYLAGHNCVLTDQFSPQKNFLKYSSLLWPNDYNPFSHFWKQYHVNQLLKYWILHQSGVSILRYFVRNLLRKNSYF